MRIWRRHDDLERRLDSERPQPRDEFVSRLTERLTPEPIRRRSGWSIALAAGLTTLLTVALALTGGIGYAAGAAKDGTTAVTSLVSSPDNPGSNETSGQSNENAGAAGKSDESSGKSSESAGKSDANAGTSDANAGTSEHSGASDNSSKSDDNSGGSNNANESGSGSQGDHKQAVCHIPPGNPDNAHTIVVDDSAVPAHLAHGDTLGPCPEEPGPPDDQYEEKVLICHIPPGNPENAHTISVSVNAVPAHLAHGDTEGPCPEDS
jgi:hypothetical protein